MPLPEGMNAAPCQLTHNTSVNEKPLGAVGSDLPLAAASSDVIRWSRVLLSHTLDAARSY